jgi:hypothetical protein
MFQGFCGNFSLFETGQAGTYGKLEKQARLKSLSASAIMNLGRESIRGFFITR